MSTLERMHNDCDGGQCAACEWEREQDDLAEQAGAAPRVQAIRRAAVCFACDYGPLPAALNGDEQAAHQVAANLVNILRREGLAIVETGEAEE